MDKKYQNDDMKYIFAIISTLMFFVVIITIIILIITYNNLYCIWVLFIPLMILFWLISLGWANNGDLDKGEMRRALAGAIFSVFIIIILLVLTGNNLINDNKDIINFFFGVVSTIIGFYFGYRSGREKKNSV
ncbi:hypothetical protein [Methanothermococcus okinawensis]|uniref:TIGR04086 family membrane protein n=1 Tax=Methanothermococcus okinawensis (strain DSM 14208 / JCM 11175 / IH1) TaxID=647113 RepID=F8ANI7_METOI|nr:hypothetical protein [Methanothermococcus okinawensis]AEH07041.1 hypothetical protein Metok_1071 [Methanothermococcus okinawensis IH1]